MLIANNLARSANLASAFQSFSLPEEIGWIALVQRTDKEYKLMGAAGNIPSSLGTTVQLKSSPPEALVLPCTSEYELWIKAASFHSLAPLPYLREFLHNLRLLFHSDNPPKKLEDEHFLYEKISRLYENIINIRSRSEILQTAADLFAELLHFKRVCLFAYSPEKQSFHGIVGHNLNNDLIKRIHEPWSNIPFAPLVLASRMPAYVPEVSRLKGLPTRYIDQFGLTSLVVTPLVANNHIIGAALMDHGGDFFEPSGEILQACLQFGNHIGKVIYHQQTNNGEYLSWLHERPLSPREAEVIQLAALGESTKEIAANLGLSDYTVRDYLTSAVEKLNARNRTEAVAIALRMGIIQ